MAEALMQRERTSMSPALLVSALLHGGLLAGALVSWPWLAKPTDIGPVVPVTIVSDAPVPDVRPAVEAPEPLEAMTEDPVVDAAPEPVAPPAPVPEPVPPPKPAAKPVPPTPAPKPKPARKAETPALDLDALDLDALAASIQPKKAAGKPRSSARRGANRPETAVEARPAVGAASGLSANWIASIAADVQDRWNPNCDVEGGGDVNLTVQIVLGGTGRMTKAPRFIRGMNSDPVTTAAALRATAAIKQVEPFRNVPPEFVGEALNLNFDAREACSR